MEKDLITGARLEAAGGDNRPMGRIMQAPKPVDVDAAFSCMVSADDYRAKRTIKLVAGENEKDFKPPVVKGFMAVLEKDAKRPSGVRFTRVRVDNTESLRSFMETDDFKRTRSLEFDSFALGGYGPGGGYSTAPFPPNNEYTPILGGPFSKQLYLFDYLSMHAKCFEAKNHNPLAKEIVDLITFFSFSKGVDVQFNNPQIDAAWSIFAKRNKLTEFLRMDSDTLTWAGEIMTHKGTFADGFPRLIHIDPSTVWEIVTDPQDIDNAYYFHQQFPTQWQLVYKPGDIGSEYVINDIPADQVIHVKINTVPGEKRGRSDLFAVLGWLKRFKDYYDARVTKAQAEESYNLDVTIKGNAGDVSAWLNDPNNSVVPSPGDKLVHNEAVEYKFLVPTTSSSGNASDGVGEAIRSIVATGVGLSPEYLGVGGRASTKATAITKSEPAARKFEDRQLRMKGYIDQIVDYFLATYPGLPATQVREASMGSIKAALQKRDWTGIAREAMALAGMSQIQEPIDTEYQIIFPEIGTDDRSVKLKDIATVQALEYISHERAAEMSASELQISDYDYDAEQEKIRTEREERMSDPLYKGDEDPAKELLGKGALAPSQGTPEAAAPGSGANDAAYKAAAVKQ